MISETQAGTVQKATNNASGVLKVRPGRSFDGLKVFSATIAATRERLGEVVTEWIASQPHVEIVEFVVSQSSDSEHHCISICAFYRGHALRDVQPSAPLARGPVLR
jgi:hypothetical protein